MASAGTLGVLGDRILAAAIDGLLCLLFIEVPLIYAASVLFPTEYQALGAAILPLSLVALLPLFSTYSFAFEWRFARTPGKVNRRLLVVGTDGQPPTVRQSAVRNLFLYVDLIGIPPVVLGTVLPLLTGGRRLGDIAAGTVVVRAGAPASEGMVGPEQLEST